MPARRSTSAHPSIAALASCAALLAAAPAARASLLDQPPRVYNFRLDDPKSPRLALLEAFREAGVDHTTSLRRYLSGQYGRWGVRQWRSLAWAPARPDLAAVRDEADPPRIERDHDHAHAMGIRVLAAGDERLFGFEPRDPSLDALSLSPEAAPAWLSRLDPSFRTALASTGVSFASNGFDALWSLPPTKPIRDWRCRRRPVHVARINGESDSFSLVRCDGSVAPEALDRLTIMARIPEAPRPGQLLPDDPDPESARRGEWAPGVRLVHPKLLWVLQRIADAFPWRPIYIFSGYRQPQEGRGGPQNAAGDPSSGAGRAPARSGGHHSLHAEARAMDINVMGIPNTALFKLCRELWDVGCGFYPNSKFVHVDVRRPGSGHPFWIDISGPGEPAHYVDSWPGVVESGGLVWDSRGIQSEAARPSSEASCVRRGAP